jgi:Na+/alanine symporter
MTDTVAISRRSHRIAALRRRATAATIGTLLGAFLLVGVTTALPSDEPLRSAAPPSAAVAPPSSPANQAQAAALAPRRIRTRQS